MQYFRKLLIGSVLILSMNGMAPAQGILSVSLEQCQALARDNYPLIYQLDLIDRSAGYQLSNASKGFLPALSLNGQASWQSDVTSVPLEIPGMEIPTVSQDQYRIYGDLYMPLTHGAHINTNKRQIQTGAEMQKMEVEVELYTLKERVNQVYFGILLADARSDQLRLMQDDIRAAMEKISAAIQNGIATASDLELLKAERIRVAQQRTENAARRKAYLTMLSNLTGQALDGNTHLRVPENLLLSDSLNRPELTLLDLKSSSLDLDLRQFSNRQIPSLGLFLQAGYGRPALNMLENTFEPYLIAGLRLKWNLGWLYTMNNDRETVEINKSMIRSQRRTFTFNTRLNQTLQNAELEKYRELIEHDDALITIRQEIRQTAEAQLENGIINTLDYINYLNAENTAKQNKSLHELQLLMAQYQYAFISGNQ